MDNLKKVASDNRGDIFQFNIGQRTHILVFFNGVTYRGGHYHSTPQWHICLAGKLQIKLFDVKSGVETEVNLTEGGSIMVPAYVAHLFKSEGDAVIAESRLGEYEATDYEPYRKLARPV